MGNRVESFFAGEEVDYEAFRKKSNGQQITASVTLSEAQKVEASPEDKSHKYHYLYGATFRLATPSGAIEMETETNRLTPDGFGGVFGRFEDFVTAAYKPAELGKDFSERDFRIAVYDLQKMVEADFCEPGSEAIREKWVVDSFRYAGR